MGDCMQIWSAVGSSKDILKFRKRVKNLSGSVWVRDGGGVAIKVEDGAPGRSVYKDQSMHRRVLEESSQLPIRIPKSYEYISITDEFWERERSMFPPEFESSSAYCVERTPTMSWTVRQSLIDCIVFQFDSEERDLDDPVADCLVRPYLGSRQHSHGNVLQMFPYTLHSLSLSIDDMEKLELDTRGYANVIADALAHCYFQVQVDAKGVDFVLAPNTHSRPASITTFDSDALGKHVVWMLNYECCNLVTMDLKGVSQAVNAFMRNKLYYPRPHSDVDADSVLWAYFTVQFIIKSQAIIDSRFDLSASSGEAVSLTQLEDSDGHLPDHVANNPRNLPIILMWWVTVKAKEERDVDRRKAQIGDYVWPSDDEAESATPTLRSRLEEIPYPRRPRLEEEAKLWECIREREEKSATCLRCGCSSVPSGVMRHFPSCHL